MPSRRRRKPFEAAPGVGELFDQTVAVDLHGAVNGPLMRVVQLLVPGSFSDGAVGRACSADSGVEVLDMLGVLGAAQSFQHANGFAYVG